MEQSRRSQWLVIGAVAAVVILVLLAGALSRGPAPKPGRQEAAMGEEPTISLYDVDRGQVKKMKMEEYLAGVVAAEMKPEWPQEALAAQAIIARTFTLKKIQSGKTRHGTDASTDVKEFQAYAPEKINENVRAAVNATRGQVITHKGEVVRAFFHSCAGGMTATAPEGIGFKDEPTPYLPVVRDSPCPQASEQDWSASFSKQEVLAALRKTTGQSIGGFDRVAVADRGPSGRATSLNIGGTTVSAADFRVALDPDRMKSTLLESLRLEGERVVMRGHGWGHGVGLSQWGALQKAKKGWDASRIINYYYKDIAIEKHWR